MSEPKPEKRIRIGGLFRCCIKTLEEAETQNIEGEELKCLYCKDGEMRFRDGAWEWKRE